MEQKLVRKGWRKRMSYPVLSFAVPFVITVAVLLALHVTPFGNNSLAISDGAYYIDHEAFLGRLLHGQENPLYSFNNGLGGNEQSLLAWGTLNPASILSMFATLETLPMIFTWICVINLALCGPTMYFLLTYLRGHRFDSLIFSTSYALIGFNVVNCFQYTFLIGPEMLPLVVLGLLKLLRGESPAIYILSFAFVTLCNPYFGFQIAVASIVLCLACLYAFKGSRDGLCKHPIRNFTGASFIGGLLPAFMWLPGIVALSGGGRLDQTGLAEFAFSENMPFVQIFAKLFTGANSTSELVNGLPNIFCGILVVALVILYFINKRVSIRNKQAVAAVLAFYLITFYITAFTLAMHGGTHTNWFPYRYSYVFSFLLIGIAAEQFKYLDSISLGDAKKSGAILLAATVIVFSNNYEFISGGSVVLDFALLLVMFGGFYLYKTKPEQSPRRAFTMLILLLVSGNLYVNCTLSIQRMQEWEMDLSGYNQSILATGAMAEAVATADDSFYRMEKDWSESGSIGLDSYLYDYKGVSHSASSERMFIHKQLNKLGISWYDMRHWYTSGVPGATDSLLGLKYIISSRNLVQEKGYERLLDLGEKSIFRNPHALSLAILADSGSQHVDFGNDPFENLNKTWDGMTGSERLLFTKAEDVIFRLHNVAESREIAQQDLEGFNAELREKIKRLDEEEASESVSGSSFEQGGRELAASTGAQAEGSENANTFISHSASLDARIDELKAGEHAYIEFEFTATHDGPVYLFNTEIPDSDSGASTEQIQTLGFFKAGDAVTGRIPLSTDYCTEKDFLLACSTAAIASANLDTLFSLSKELQSRYTTFEVQDEARPHGEFTAEADQRLLFTIPWDEGWKCYIDGQEVPIEKTWDLFMSVDAPEGFHMYELVFFPAWMDVGIVISCIALMVFALLMLLRRRRAKEHAGAFPFTSNSLQLAVAEAESGASMQSATDGSLNLASEDSRVNGERS